MTECFKGVYECVRVKREPAHNGQWASLFREVVPDTGETITLVGGMMEEERPAFEEGRRYHFGITVREWTTDDR